MNKIFIEAESFERLGGWVIDQQSMEQMGSAYLMAHGLGVPVEDAETRFDVAADAVYTIWARTRDWTAVWDRGSSAGQFQLLVDGRALEVVLGTNGPAWAWQRAGQVRLSSGEHTLALHDMTGFNGRCDAILLTDDADFTPPDEGETMAELRKALSWKQVQEDEQVYDLVVVGGGVAGICMALAAKRSGASVLLLNDREVLGGCNSSEIRVCMGGMIHLPPYERLGDIVKEIAPVMGDPGIFGASYYEDDRKRQAFELRETKHTPHTIRLGEHAVSIEIEGGIIKSVETVNIRSGCHTRFFGKLFADCTGDATLARMAGCEVMYGREGQDAFGEELAAAEYEYLVMGHSLRWYSKPQNAPSPFPNVDWDIPFTEETCYHVRNGDWEQEAGFRRDMVGEIEYIRDYGLRAIFSNWHYQKNLSARRAEYSHDALEWISPIGGKRESYRVVGDHILTQQDIEDHIIHPDASACMTWSIDIHFPEPDNEAHFGEAFRSFAYHRGIGKPYPVPYRCLYARDAKNLFLGGRDISTSHVAFSSIRVMRTLGALGEVAGLAAAICARHGVYPRDIYDTYLEELKEAMTLGVPSPDAFHCSCGSEESYHFKDIGWIHFHKYHCDTPEELAKFKRNIKKLSLSHKYPYPEDFWD
ncbi:MAG: FAD-dependent oxidoreductase [Clostridiales bacterium]|nr:FAD-dependent oxidoreductase [Clostridiales bacterium]